MAGKPGSTRLYLTTFSPEQLRILKGTFEKNMYPYWVTMTALTSATHLDELVIKIWFKNQRIKRRKQQLQTQPSVSLEVPNQIISAKEENPFPVISTNSRPVSSSILDANDCEPLKPSGIEQPGGAGASVWNASRDSQPHDLQ
ncbi:hypothetical protein mRhiFer1_007690 [Rhinolophus ferrumequinum]|uniref:Homeobox domain-containing protein n=1 Tax=Rhinolophus ferrumequinum TaxID=59479 RepID=A0A7J7YT42_RHIFE|nr:hypothetical protein mRhiFer1_007690 [Rhinolophus ferrumequinum]